MASARLFDVSPDGHRFLLVHPMDEAAAPPMTVVVNWNAGIRR